MPYLQDLAIKIHSTDEPGPRKVHDHVIPKCGGLGMVVGATTPVLLWVPKLPAIKGLMIGSLIIILFGVADDIKDLKPRTKLMGQFMAALAVILVGGIKITDLGNILPTGMFLPDWVAIPLTVLVIVGVTNAANLADGLDGLAGGMSLMILICLAYLAIDEGARPLAIIAIALGGSIFGFLRFNSHPAQLFMGDVGSQLLGYVAVVLALSLTQQSAALSVTLPLIIFGIPVLDTLTVMVKRLAKGRSPFVADRKHFHHQLMAIGLHHTEAVFILYSAQALLILLAIAGSGSNDWLLLGAYLIFASLALGAFYFFARTDYQVNRDGWIAEATDRLRPLKDRGRIIKYSFGMLKVGVPVLLITNALILINSSITYLLFTGGFLALLFLAWIYKAKKLHRIAKVALYFYTPFLVFNCDETIYAYFGKYLIVGYNCLYLVLLASILITMKFTRRTTGFKASTLDFLVFFIILLIPNLPGTGLTSQLLGLVAIKTVIFYYGYEVLIGEQWRDTSSRKLEKGVEV